MYLKIMSVLFTGTVMATIATLTKGDDSLPAAESLPLKQRSSAEIKALWEIEHKRGPTDPEVESRAGRARQAGIDPNEARAFDELILLNLWQTKQLAEKFFAATGRGRQNLAQGVDIRAIRDVAYRIHHTVAIGPVEAMPKTSGGRGMKWFLQWLCGPQEGVFLVLPSDGKPLEKYRLLISGGTGERTLRAVEKDPKFDPVAYQRQIERDRLPQDVANLLTGKRQDVIKHLPPGDYSYLDAPNLSASAMSVHLEWAGKAGQTAGANATAGETWRGEVEMWLDRPTPQFCTTERLQIKLRKRNGRIDILACIRDKAHAKSMAENVEVAKFIVEFVGNPGKRAKWLAPDGEDKLPKDVVALWPDEQHKLPLQIIKYDEARDDGGPTYDGVCGLLEPNGDRGERMMFTVVNAPGGKGRFLMLSADKHRPMN